MKQYVMLMMVIASFPTLGADWRNESTEVLCNAVLATHNAQAIAAILTEMKRRNEPALPVGCDIPKISAHIKAIKVAQQAQSEQRSAAAPSPSSAPAVSEQERKIRQDADVSECKAKVANTLGPPPRQAATDGGLGDYFASQKSYSGTINGTVPFTLRSAPDLSFLSDMTPANAARQGQAIRNWQDSANAIFLRCMLDKGYRM